MGLFNLPEDGRRGQTQRRASVSAVIWTYKLLLFCWRGYHTGLFDAAGKSLTHPQVSRYPQK
jgi:hypothetical protein